MGRLTSMFFMRGPWTWAVLLLMPLVTVLPLRADDVPAGGPPGPAPVARPAPTPTLAQVGEAVLAAFASQDEAALKVLAGKDEPDPWFVADELLRRGAAEAAEAFATAAPRKATEKLPDYVVSRRGLPDDPARRERLERAEAAATARDPAGALEALGAEEASPAADVVGVRLAMVRGIELENLQRLDASYLLLRATAEAAERMGWGAGAARAHHAAGFPALAAGRFAEALDAFERGLAAFESVGDRVGAAKDLGNIGLAHLALGNLEQARDYQQRTLQQWEALGDRAQAARTLGNLAEVHHSLGDFAKALEGNQRAVAEKEALGDAFGAAKSWGGVANALMELGNVEAALSAYERALTVFEALGARTWVAACWENLGLAYTDLGEYPKALVLLERALVERETLGERAAAADTLGRIGNIHSLRGDYAKALSLYERAQGANEAAGDKVGSALNVGSLGAIHVHLGEFARAFSLLERAHAALEAAGSRQHAATVLYNLGVLHGLLGDRPQQLATFERVLAMRRALGDRAGEALTWLGVGDVQRGFGDLEQALAALERALALCEALGFRGMLAQVWRGLGLIHETRGEHAEALSYYQRWRAACEELGEKGQVASALVAIGDAQASLGDLKAARSSLELAVRSARSLRDGDTLVRGLESLAALHLEAGSASRALGAAREALRESESLLGGLGEEQAATARETLVSLFEVGALAAAREEDPAEALSFLESGRAGALLDALDKRETLRWKAQSLPEELRTADERAAAAERRARQAYEKTLQGDDRKARAQALRVLDDALEEVRAIHARIQREVKRAAGLFYPRAKTLEQVQAALLPGEALVLYGLCEDEALALVVEVEAVRLVALGAREEVEAACAALDARKPDTEPGAALATLRRLLVAPLALAEGVTQVLVSPEGPLCFLPWGALIDAPVAVTPSGSTHVLLRADESAPGTGVLALGDPDYAGISEGAQAIYYRGRTLGALPATRREAQAVSTVALLGAEASEAGFAAALPKEARWRAIHFACHGLIDPRRPALSSLALSRAGEDDGFLTSLEVLRMQVPADLAVLSACETATGKLVGGEGIVGLTRAFMYAGTPRVLCSLWKVDDEATAALMAKFYECWLGGGRGDPDAGPGPSQAMSAAEALRQAQAFVRAEAKWSHPTYWAAWVLWGLP